MSGYVGIGYEPSGLTPVSNSFSGTGASAAFSPVAGRDFNIWLSGSGSATIQLEKSFDGSTWFPVYAGGTQLYVWSYSGSKITEAANESEADVQFRLNCTAYSSGPISYRISQ